MTNIIQTMTVPTTAAQATQIIQGSTPAQSVLIVNSDSVNTLYISDQPAFNTGDPNHSIAISAGGTVVLDGVDDIYALASGAPIQVLIVPGGVQYFLPTSRLVIFGSNSAVLVYNAPPSFGHLIASISAQLSTDQYGDVIQAGITSYDPSTGSYVQLFHTTLTFHDVQGNNLAFNAVAINGVSYLAYTINNSGQLFFAPSGGLAIVDPNNVQTPETWHILTPGLTWSRTSIDVPQPQIEAVPSPIHSVRITADITGPAIAGSPSGSILTVPSGYIPPLNVNIPIAYTENRGANNNPPTIELDGNNGGGVPGRMRLYNCVGCTRISFDHLYAMDYS